MNGDSQIFNCDLYEGMPPDPAVKQLQRLLNSDPDTKLKAESGHPGSPGNETDTFGPLTAEAVLRFQTKHKIVEIGPKTREILRQIFNHNKNGTKITPQANSPVIENAVASAKKQLGISVQPCNTVGCKYNQESPRETACRTPTSPAKEEEKEKGRHIDNHAVWLFHCMQFVRICFGAPPAGDAIEVYNLFNRNGVVNKDYDIPLGAIVFWDWSKYGHVGIHIGENQIIHTGLNSTEKGVRIESLDEISKLKFLDYLGWANPPDFWLKK